MMRLRRPILILAGCAAAAGCGVAGASALTAAPDDVAPLSVVPAAGSESIDARAADPRGGPDWAVRAYRNDTGGICLEANRYDGTTFGRVGESGQLVELPLDPAGTGICGNLSKEPLFVVLSASPAREGQAARTAVYGALAAGTTSLTVTKPDGSRTRPQLGPRGTFVVAVEGLKTADSGFAVDATLADGTKVHREL